MKGTFQQDRSNMLDQLFIRAGALRARSLRYKRTYPSFPLFIHTRTGPIPNPAGPLQAVNLSHGDRAGLAHLLDLRRAKGDPASRRAAFSRRSSLSIVSSPTFFLSLPICSSFGSRSARSNRMAGSSSIMWAIPTRMSSTTSTRLRCTKPRTFCRRSPTLPSSY